MKLTKISIDKIKPAPYNPRIDIKDNPDFYEKLKNSIEKFGYVEPIIYNKRTGHIVGGNQRYQILKDKGIKEIEVVEIDLPEEDEKALNIALNKISGDWDFPKLNELILDLEEQDYDIELTGFDEKEIDKLFEDIKEEYNPQYDFSKDIKDWKILNLYAGIGGNRKFWGDNLNITAVEINPEIAKAYQKFFPNDKVIVEDAHKYLEKHFKEYDFIWTSPPCPTHSRMRKNFSKSEWRKIKPKYPDLRLYEEILFLQGYYEGLWVVENVISWYDPLIEPQKRGRHYFWSNFEIPENDFPQITTIGKEIGEMNVNEIKLKEHLTKFGYKEEDFYEIPNLKDYPREKIIRNLIHPSEGEYILNCAINHKSQN